MSYYSIICIIVLIFSIISCGSSRKDAAREKGTKHSDSAQTEQMQADTAPDMPPPPEPAPAPETLRLQGKIIEIHSTDHDSATIYEVQVLKTLGMGAGTPAVVRDDTIKIASSKRYPEMSGGMVIRCSIKYRRTMAKQQDSAARWQLLQWEYNTNKD